MKENTSWNNIEKWYSELVGEEGHYYHKQIVLPGVLRLLELHNFPTLPKVLDLACGQGVLARVLPQEIPYHGVDVSPALVESAKKLTRRDKAHFTVGDICTKLPLPQDFTHAAMVLALQNLAHPSDAIAHAGSYLAPSGTFVLILNHPCFRIPRQTHWGIDEPKKIQYRRIDRYMTPLKIPIQASPGRKASKTTWSFHHPLSDYIQWLSKAGFQVNWMEEWTSDKVSTGRAAKMENRAREEFPLFLALRAVKSYSVGHDI